MYIETLKTKITALIESECKYKHDIESKVHLESLARMESGKHVLDIYIIDPKFKENIICAFEERLLNILLHDNLDFLDILDPFKEVPGIGTIIHVKKSPSNDSRKGNTSLIKIVRENIRNKRGKEINGYAVLYNDEQKLYYNNFDDGFSTYIHENCLVFNMLDALNNLRYVRENLDYLLGRIID